MTKQYLLEVHTALKKYSLNESIEDNFTRLNIRVPVLRKLAKSSFSFSKDPFVKSNAWGFIWNTSQYFEAMSLALYSFQKQSINHADFLEIISWVDRCSCWEHSDDLSKIYAQVVEENPDWIIPFLKKWNHSTNPWKRRQSLVSLLEYSCKRKKVLSFEELISYVIPLLNDAEYYVQKGLGWTLREIYNIYPNETLRFIKANLNSLTPIAYSSSTEKLDKETKKALNLQRKLFRKKP